MAENGSGAKNGSGSENGSGQAPRLPLFYKKPVPLQLERHAAYRVNSQAGFGFAADANAVPINAAEFLAAARHHPIVFAAGDEATPLVVLGLRDGENLSLDEQGKWRTGVYIPAYVRRYPFIFMSAEGDDRFTLCIDEDAEAVTEEGDGEPLFVSGEASLMANRALEFCTAYQREAAVTQALAVAIKEQDLLTASSVNLSGQKLGDLSLGGFQVVDEKKFN